MPAKNETREDSTIPFVAHVWQVLSKVDVADHIETAEVKKDGRVVYTYPYLGWAWCWATLMKHFPESPDPEYQIEYLPDNTVMVHVKQKIVRGEDKATRKFYLPVMDGRNNSISNPTSRDLNDAQQRAFVKVMARFGLGLDLWTKTDYPVGMADEAISDDQAELLAGMFDRLTQDSKDAFLIWAGVESVVEIPVARYKSARGMLERKLRAQAQS